jgi:hypothetical protein
VGHKKLIYLQKKKAYGLFIIRQYGIRWRATIYVSMCCKFFLNKLYKFV